MSKQSPTQRAIDLCTARGWIVARCEYTVKYGRRHVSRDLFGFADLIAIDGEPGSLLIQVTDNTHVSERRHKILGKVQPNEKPEQAQSRCEAALRWLDYGNRIEVWGFYPTRMDPRIVSIGRLDFFPPHSCPNCDGVAPETCIYFEGFDHAATLRE